MEAQHRNSDADVYQIRLRSSFEGPIDGREGREMDVEAKMPIPIQTGDIVMRRIRRITKSGGGSS